MTEGTALLLTNHLHELKLGAMLRQYPSLVRQARETGQDYEEFLLTLAETEIRTRAENRLKRRIRDARFPLLVFCKTFFLKVARHFSESCNSIFPKVATPFFRC
jgi:DNA replication protein DnaC